MFLTVKMEKKWFFAKKLFAGKFGHVKFLPTQKFALGNSYRQLNSPETIRFPSVSVLVGTESDEIMRDH